MPSKEEQMSFDDSYLRLYIIEKAILVEELVSRVIGTILNIDSKNSKSFGSGSTSLSFNQKIQIIIDIHGMDKVEVDKCSTLMNIRNKFAHVYEIRKFSDFFEKSSVGKLTQNKLDKWYLENKDIKDKDEEIYKKCFDNLIDDIIKIVFSIATNHNYQLGKEEGKKLLNDKLIAKLNTFIEEKVEGGSETTTKLYNEVIKELSSEWSSEP